jgi:hypothetical protein
LQPAEAVEAVEETTLASQEAVKEEMDHYIMLLLQIPTELKEKIKEATVVVAVVAVVANWEVWEELMMVPILEEMAAMLAKVMCILV